MIKTTAHIVEKIQSTQDTVLLRVSFPERASFSFIPGQFCMISSAQFCNEDGQPLKRSYSIASAPHEELLEFCIRATGTGGFSDFCAGLCIGDELILDGPHGRFMLAAPSPHTEHIALIGAGTGIAPLMSMLRHLCRENKAQQVTVIYGIKTMQDCIYADEFAQYAHQGATIHLCTSREVPNKRELAPRMQLHHERVTVHIHKLIDAPKKTAAYLCGSPDMVKATKETLQAHGVDPAHIHREMW